MNNSSSKSNSNTSKESEKSFNQNKVKIPMLNNFMANIKKKREEKNLLESKVDSKKTAFTFQLKAKPNEIVEKNNADTPIFAIINTNSSTSKKIGNFAFEKEQFSFRKINQQAQSSHRSQNQSDKIQPSNQKKNEQESLQKNNSCLKNKKQDNLVHTQSKCKSQAYKYETKGVNKGFQIFQPIDQIPQQNNYVNNQQQSFRLDKQNPEQNQIIQKRHFPKLSQALLRFSSSLQHYEDFQIEQIIEKAKQKAKVSNLQKQNSQLKISYQQEKKKVKILQQELQIKTNQQQKNVNREIRRMMGILSQKQSSLQNLLGENQFLKQKLVSLETQLSSLHSAMFNIESFAIKTVDQSKNLIKELQYQIENLKVDKKLIKQKFDQTLSKLQQVTVIKQERQRRYIALQEKNQMFKNKFDQINKNYCEVKQQFQKAKTMNYFKNQNEDQCYNQNHNSNFKNFLKEKYNQILISKDQSKDKNLLENIISIKSLLEKIKEQSIAQKKYRQLQVMYIRQKGNQDELKRKIHEKDQEIIRLRSQINPSYINQRFIQQKPQIYEYLLQKKKQIEEYLKKIQSLCIRLNGRDQKIQEIINNTLNKNINDIEVQTEEKYLQNHHEQLKKTNKLLIQGQDYSKNQKYQKKQTQASNFIQEFKIEKESLISQIKSYQQQAHLNKIKYYDERNQKEVIQRKLQFYREDISENIVNPKKGRKKKNRCYGCLLTDAFGKLVKCLICKNFYHENQECKKKHKNQCELNQKVQN